MRCKIYLTLVILIVSYSFLYSQFGDEYKSWDKKVFDIDYKSKGSLIMTVSAFHEEEHKFEWCSDQDLCLIDGSPFFGTDQRIPDLELISLVYKNRQVELNLEVNGMYNPWNGNHTPYNAFEIIQRGNIIEVKGYFSDGAGAYEASWKIVNRGSIRTSIFCSD